ncbi:MAG: tetratricopeptide repeat-containing protein, partial [Bacteroidota bacterium]
TSYQGKAKTYEFLLPQEAIITLEQILDKTKSARLRGINFMDDLQRIMQAVRILKFDKSHPYTIELAASICAELGHYQKAASYYLQLKEAKKAVWFVRSFEQYFNVQMAAHMATFSAAQTPEEKDEIYGIMVNLKERFDRLCEEDLLDTNGERYNLIGSANKRCYLAASEDNKQAHLDQAATSYRKALLLDAKKGEQLDFYPLCNWLPIALVASDQEKAEIKKILGKKGPQAYVLDYFSEAEEKPIAKTNFWDEVKQVNIMTTLIFVWRGRKDRITYYKDEIKKRYRRAWRKGGSVKNRESEASTAAAKNCIWKASL